MKTLMRPRVKTDYFRMFKSIARLFSVSQDIIAKLWWLQMAVQIYKERLVKLGPILNSKTSNNYTALNR